MEICRRLLGHGKDVRGLVRVTSAPEKVEQLRSMGVEIAVGDLRDRASLDRALVGVDTVISSAGAVSNQQADLIGQVDQAGQLDLVDAAVAAGVKHFIFVSFSKNLQSDSPLHQAKWAVEAKLKTSGMTYTILRPSYFMEYWLSPLIGFDHAKGEVNIYGEGTNKISWIALGDVAEFAARSVDNPAAQNEIIELGGPQALSPDEVVYIFQRVTGRTFKVQKMPQAVIQSQWENAPDALWRSLSALTRDYSLGDVVEMEQTAKTFGMRLVTVEEYAERVSALQPEQTH
jgi:NADH dehydrogenase